jgi:Putative zinc-finger
VSTTTGACAHAESRMQAYLDNLLSPADTLVVEQHLEACSDCACAYRFEVKLREHVKACCGGKTDEEHCREELLAKLKACCGGAADDATKS